MDEVKPLNQLNGEALAADQVFALCAMPSAKKIVDFSIQA